MISDNPNRNRIRKPSPTYDSALDLPAEYAKPAPTFGMKKPTTQTPPRPVRKIQGY